MRSAFQASVTRKNLRLVLAVFFTVVLCAEWGAHGVILSHHANGEGQTASSSERGHDDPCKTLISNDGRQRDQGFRFSHQSSQHNAFFDQLSNPDQRLVTVTNDGSPHSKAVAISRPPDPEFHPPEFS